MEITRRRNSSQSKCYSRSKIMKYDDGYYLSEVVHNGHLETRLTNFTFCICGVEPTDNDLTGWDYQVDVKRIWSKKDITLFMPLEDLIEADNLKKRFLSETTNFAPIFPQDLSIWNWIVEMELEDFRSWG